MTNDTNTLNGALSELGETMASNLTTMGINSSASEGLTTLAGKILNIQADLRISTSLTKTVAQSSATNYVVSGTLSGGSPATMNKSLTITVAKTYHGSTSYDTYTTTTVNGEYSRSFTVSSDNISVAVKVEFAGDSKYKSCMNDYND